MANSDILKEYLIALGFKIDETQLRKFNGIVGQTTKTAVELGAAVVTTAIAVEAFVGRIAGQMEKLYYASQRSQATVGNMMAIEAAAAQVGMTTDQMRGAIESLGSTLRSQPGLTGYLKSLGIDPANKDTAEILLRLVGRLKEMGPPGSLGFAVAQQIGQQFGIDPQTLIMLAQNYERLTKSAADYAKQQKEAGIDPGDLAEKSVTWARAMSRLENTFGLLTQRIADDFLPVATRVLDWAESAVEWFIQLDIATDRWASRISTVVVGALGAWIAKAVALKTILRGVAGEAANAAAAGSPGFLGSLLRYGSGVGGFIAGMHASELNKGEDAAVDELWRQHGGRPTEKADPNAPLGIRQNNPGNLRTWGGADTVNGFASFPTALAGLSAMAKNLLNYAGNGIRRIRDIITTWAPSSDGNDVGAYIADVVKRTGFGETDVLNLKDPEVLEKLMKAMIHHEQGQQPYDDATIRAAIAGRLGLPTGYLVPGGQQGGTVINQKTDITVNGASDPDGTARSIGAEQDRVNGDLVRNAAGALR